MKIYIKTNDKRILDYFNTQYDDVMLFSIKEFDTMLIRLGYEAGENKIIDLNTNKIVGVFDIN